MAGGSATDFWPALLVVDDSVEMRRTLGLYFEKRGFHVAEAGTLQEAKAHFLRRARWTLVLSDLHLPDGNGLELSRWIHEQPGAAPALVLMSGSGIGSALCPHAEVLEKPFRVEELERRVQAALRLRPS